MATLVFTGKNPALLKWCFLGRNPVVAETVRTESFSHAGKAAFRVERFGVTHYASLRLGRLTTTKPLRLRTELCGVQEITPTIYAIMAICAE